MNDDELRDLLGRVDPMPPPRSVAAASSPWARQLLEEIMATDINDTAVTAATVDRVVTPITARRRWLLAAAAAVVAVGVGLGVWAASGDDAPTARQLALDVAPFDPATSICMPFDPAQLSGAELAFAGTVTSIEGGTVRLDVSETFRGDVPDTVTLDAGGSPALDGVAFTDGGRYLVAATDGTVGGCGSSGPDDPTLRAAYEQAFGG